MKSKNIKRVLLCIVCILLILLLGISNTKVNKSTKALESKLSKGVNSKSDITKNLFDFGYDKVYVFQPYLTKDDMEEEIGFKFYKLKDSVSEGIVNILFVKNNSPVAYLYGHPSNIGYYIDLPIGEYTKSQLDKIQYKSVLNKGKDSFKEEDRYISYTFDI